MPTPNYPRDFGDEWNTMRANMRALFTAANNRRPLTRIKVRALELFGDLVIRNDGQIALYAPGHPNEAVIYIGRTYDAETGEREGWAASVQRLNGADLLLAQVTNDGRGAVTIRDSEHNAVVSTPLHGKWLGQPSIPYPLPVNTGTVDTVPNASSSIWTTVAQSSMHVQHARLYAYAYVYWNTGTEGEVRLTAEGIQLSPTHYVGEGGSSLKIDIDMTEHFQFYDYITFELELRVTSGSERVGAQVVSLFGYS